MKVLFVIRDLVAGVYFPIQSFSSVGEALRWHRNLLSDPKMPFSQYPSDYEICYVGQFDDVSGSVISLEPVEAIHLTFASLDDALRQFAAQSNIDVSQVSNVILDDLFCNSKGVSID